MPDADLEPDEEPVVGDPVAGGAVDAEVGGSVVEDGVVGGSVADAVEDSVVEVSV